MPDSRPSAAGPTTRDSLLRVGAEMFAERGYAGASLRRLAEQLGLTTGAIYGNFRNKADLMLEIIDERLHRELEAFGRRRLPEYVAMVRAKEAERIETRALLLEAVAAARTDAKLKRRLRSSHQSLLDIWARDYRDWQRNSGVDPALDMDELLRLLWAIELGTGVLEAFGIDLSGGGRRRVAALRQQRAQIIERFLSSLEAAPDGDPAPQN